MSDNVSIESSEVRVDDRKDYLNSIVEIQEVGRPLLLALSNPERDGKMKAFLDEATEVAKNKLPSFQPRETSDSQERYFQIFDSMTAGIWPDKSAEEREKVLEFAKWVDGRVQTEFKEEYELSQEISKSASKKISQTS